MTSAGSWRGRLTPSRSGAGRRGGEPAAATGRHGAFGRRRTAGRSAVRAETTVVERMLTGALIGLVAVLAWTLLFAFGISRIQRSHDQAGLYDRFRSQLAAATAPVGGPIKAGTPVAMLQSAAAGLRDLVVVEGTSASQLRHGPGLYPGSALPGQAGTVTVFGKGATYGAPFGNLTSLGKGDVITATTGQGVFHYVVLDVRQAGDPLPAPVADGGSRLTLTGSRGTGWDARWIPSHAVFVDADLAEKAQPRGGGVAVATSADGLMRSDQSGLYPLVLWLQLLLAAVAGTSWAVHRWSRWQAWLVGAPVVLLGLWGATNCAAVLLPNLV